MWKEWLYPYNPFNSMKILAWQKTVQDALDWIDGKTETLPPPRVVTVDPTNTCNVNCLWCKLKDFRRAEPVSITNDLFLFLPTQIKEWGVSKVVLSGGEPLLHPKIGEFMMNCNKLGLGFALKTNAVMLSKALIRNAVLEGCDWIGVSADASSVGTYLRVKRATVNSFDKAMTNVKWLAENRKNGKPRITLKFVIHHLNYNEMQSFVELAKKIGADDVHFRPLYMPKYVYTKGVRKTAEYHLRDARKNFEDDKFKVFGIVQKYEREWGRAIRFAKCRVLPITGTFAANEIFYLCSDRRGDKTLNLGSYSSFKDLRAVWGSKEHRDKINSIVPHMCQKCGMTLYNETIENAFIKDEMGFGYI